MNEEFYNDWLGDHGQALLEDFAEENQDAFDQFCKNKFGEWRDQQ